MTDSRLAVIVLAAGAGTRMRSRTAKVLHPIAGVPMIGHVLQTAQELGAAHVVAVLRHERDAVAAAVAEYAPEALVADQDEVPGTGRAAEAGLAALPADFDGDVVVVSGDVPLLDAGTLGELLTAHRAASAAATLLSAIVDDPAGYGRIVRDGQGRLSRIVEQKDATDAERAIAEINSGTYVFAAAALRQQLPRLAADNAQGERYLTDVVGLLGAAGSAIAAVPVADAWRIEGVNDRVQLSRMAARLNAIIVHRHQMNGVTVVDPATTWIEQNVSIGEDAVIWPNTRLAGATTIDRGAVIGPDTTLVDCEVGEDATVKRADATLALIGPRATVGPFAYLRPGTELGADGKIGTYVETKNAKIGEGSKVPHLSYIGDTTIGEHTNIGAGAITANYDDVHKHPTTIGSHVHSGSHTVFVAPVTLGDGAKTGAGAVVRKDVPAGALAMSVAPQRNIEGWVEKNRAGTESARVAAAAEEGTGPAGGRP